MAHGVRFRLSIVPRQDDEAAAGQSDDVTLVGDPYAAHTGNYVKNEFRFFKLYIGRIVIPVIPLVEIHRERHSPGFSSVRNSMTSLSEQLAGPPMDCRGETARFQPGPKVPVSLASEKVQDRS